MTSPLNGLRAIVARPVLAIAVLASSVASGQCPDDGKTVFCEVDKGFKGVTFLGGDSYQGFFVGSKFKAGDDPDRVVFWVDDLLLEWKLINPEASHVDARWSTKKQLSSYFRFEIDYINDLQRKNQIRVAGIKLFKPISIKGEGGERTFQIMRAVLGKKGEQVPQYWVATTHPRGIVLLSLIQPKKADSKVASRFIDSYMGSFSGVDAALCETIRSQQPQQK
jgi:hypothetical protein